MPPAARITDLHVCPMTTGPVPHVGGPIIGPGAPTVLIGNLPASVVGDSCTCVGPPDSTVKGSATVLIGNKPAVRLGDTTAHGGSIVLGAPNVMIGGRPVAMVGFNRDPEWLGRGWGFPPEFDLRSHEVGMVSAAEDIAESLAILLSTAPGERIMNPSYGCGLRTLVFESISETTITQIQDTIERAVLFFEPRITLDSVEVDVAEVYRGLMHLRLDYTIKSANSRSNIVYPFYFQEGTSVSLQ